MENVFEWTFKSTASKGKTWYVIGAIIAMTVTFWSFLVGQVMLGVVIILFCGVYLLYEINSSELVHVQINDHGMGVDDTFYDMSKIESFGIIYLKDKPYLLRIRFQKKFASDIDLFLHEGIEAHELRNYLKHFIFEDESMDLSGVDKVLHYFKLY